MNRLSSAFSLQRTVSWQRLAVTLLAMGMATTLLRGFYIDGTIWRDVIIATAGAFIASETVRHATKPKAPPSSGEEAPP